VASLAARLASKSERSGDHLLWRGAVDGRGSIKVDRRTMTVRRVAWELRKGPLPPDARVLVSCDEPACIAADHLVLAGEEEPAATPAPPPRGGPRRQRGSGSMRERSPGVWELAVVHGLDPEGRPRRALRTFRGPAIDASKALAARQVSRSGAWRLQGDRSPAHWMARRTGCSVGQAVGVLETAKRLTELPQTDQAARAGRLSEMQTSHIASAAAAAPSAETELLSAAQTEGLAGLKQRCAQVKAAATPNEAARHEAIHNSRYLRHWSALDGAFCLEGRLTPEAGAVLLVALEPYKERIFRRARKAGRRDRYEAYAADALVEMGEHVRNCTGKPGRSAPSAMIHVRVDHAALMRGFTEAGERCEIPGVGPISVASARALTNDAFLAAVLTEGADIRGVAHLGRTINARLRTALEVRDQTCVVPGCDVREHLQIDHTLGVVDGGPTCLSNLSRLCSWHHYLKTHHRYRLAGEPGAWSWTPPKDRVSVPQQRLPRGP